MVSHSTDCYPEEACGLLAGRVVPKGARLDRVVEAFLLVTNRLHSEQAFEMEPVELLAQLKWIDDANLEMVGVYHTHPSGPPQPSQVDVAGSLGPEVYSIICIPVIDENKPDHSAISWQARGFIINGESTSEVNIKVIDV